MNKEEFIENMVASGFSNDQIKRDCWNFVLKSYSNALSVEGMIYLAMDLYADILKRLIDLDER